MQNNIIFKSAQLTVTDAHLKVGAATVLYPSISAVWIRDRNRFLPTIAVAAIVLVPVGFLLFGLSRLFGEASFMPMLAGAVPLAALLWREYFAVADASASQPMVRRRSES